MILKLVDAEVENLDAAFVKLGLELGGVAQFGRADGSEILGVAEQYRPGAFNIIVEVNRAFAGISGEIGGAVSPIKMDMVLFLTGGGGTGPGLRARG